MEKKTIEKVTLPVVGAVHVMAQHFMENTVQRIFGNLKIQENSMAVIKQVAITNPQNFEKIIMVRTEIDTKGNQYSKFEPQVVSTPGVLIARIFSKT